MNAVSYTTKRTPESHLERVIEPLASYISAANRPQAALRSALAVLLSIVEETNRAAHSHLSQKWEHN